MTTMVVYLPTNHVALDSVAVMPDPAPDGSDVVGWSQVDVTFADLPRAHVAGADLVAPVLDMLCERNCGRWWFLNRDWGWRIYFRGMPLTEVTGVLNQATRADYGGSWTAKPATSPAPAPKSSTARLHGPAGSRALVMADLHCGDTRGVLDYLRDRPLLAPRHIAGILTTVMCRAAGLSSVQTADFVDQHWLGETPLDESARVRAHGLTEMLGAYLRAPATRLLELDSYAARWASELTHAAERLRDIANEGFVPTLREPTPASLQHDLRLAVAAHWNRLGFSPADQAILAVAIRNALWAKGKR